jgi:hypothetical protein
MTEKGWDAEKKLRYGTNGKWQLDRVKKLTADS